jgi:beta-lactamase regulating signal transducer with metallopeptidase domain/peroxiredoxin
MNMLSTALLAYVELGLILALAYVLLRLVRWSVQRRIEPAGMILVGRVLFVAMLVSPLAAHWLLSLQAPTIDGAASSTSTTVEELAEMLRGLSGLLSSQLAAYDSGAVGAAMGGLDPLWIRTATLALAALLLAGLTLSAVRTARRILQLRALIRAAVPFRSLGRVSIVVSERASVPFSTAIFGRAHVILPVGLLQDPLLLQVTVRHELQHYRRRDPLWTVGLELFRVIYFWNPGAHGWARELTDLQELACDEAVLRRGVPAEDYGNCLLRVAEMAVARRIVASTTMATLSDRGVHLRRRIDMLFRDSSQTSARRWAVSLTALCSLLLILAATTTAANWPGTPPTTADGHDDDCEKSDCTPVPKKPIAAVLPDLEFQSPSGAPVSLSSLEGQVVVVEFWASWCKYCQREVAYMKDIHERLAGPEFQMVGVSLSKTPEATQEFIEEHGVSWPQMHAEGGWQSEAGQAFGVTGVPARYLIDRTGQVTPLPRGNPERLARMIVDAIEGKQVVTAAAR